MNNHSLIEPLAALTELAKMVKTTSQNRDRKEELIQIIAGWIVDGESKC